MITLAEARGWVVGYADEVWWSRLAQPNVHSWTPQDEEVRLPQRERDRADPDPAALCCYGLLRADNDAMLLRFVEGRPVSQVTVDYLAWVSEQLAEQGATVLLLIWDNASWHGSKVVRTWLREHNRAARQAQQHGQPAVRIMAVWLPSKSPWLNNIEPKWMQGKKAIVEPERKLTADETRERICSHFGCECLEPLKQNQQD